MLATHLEFRMPAKFQRFRSRSARSGMDRGALISDLLRGLPVDYGPRTLRSAVRVVQAHFDGGVAADRGWSFVMLSPSQNRLVVRYLAAHSRRKVVALELWALCFEHLLMDTGEIALSRSEFAKELGVDVGAVSRIMGELVTAGAISTRRDGRGVRYFMNPCVGTHLPGAARSVAQAAFGPLKLVGP